MEKTPLCAFRQIAKTRALIGIGFHTSKCVKAKIVDPQLCVTAIKRFDYFLEDVARDFKKRVGTRNSPRYFQLCMQKQLCSALGAEVFHHHKRTWFAGTALVGT